MPWLLLLHRHHTNERKEAARFMCYAQRATVATNDIDQAFRKPNIEPTAPHATFPHSGVQYRIFSTRRQGYCFVENEDNDIDRVLQQVKVTLPKLVLWTVSNHQFQKICLRSQETQKNLRL